LYAGFQPRYASERTHAATELYAELARGKGLTTAQLALAWCASRWFMGSVIIGATTLAQLKWAACSAWQCLGRAGLGPARPGC
jgi:aryl-alcohol dehydrogenase-like predicted oxidoreductase